jgi:mono/diheme cytochrome c family protein
VIRSKIAALSAVLILAVGAGTASVTAHFGGVPARDHRRQNPFAGQPDAMAAGALLYRDHCAQCHQADARGDGRKRPSLRSAQVRAATDGDLEWFLRQGDLRHGMPSWSSLPEAQRWQIVTYLRSLR